MQIKVEYVVIAVVAVAGYLWYAKSKSMWPFN